MPAGDIEFGGWLVGSNGDPVVGYVAFCEEFVDEFEEGE